MYHLYIVQSIGGRCGFGIATDIKGRNQHYASHSGDIVKFPVVFAGLRAHAKAVEKTIKREFQDEIWTEGDWHTEWLEKTVTADHLEKYVSQLITERHFQLSILARDYDFTQDV